MSKLCFAARRALALAAIASVTPACQSGLSLGALTGKKSHDKAHDKARHVAERSSSSSSDDHDGDGDRERGSSEAADVAEAGAPASGGGEGGVDWCQGRDTGYRPTGLDIAVRNATGFGFHTISALAIHGCWAKIPDDERDEAVKLYDKLKTWSKLPAGEVRDYLSALVADPAPIDKACESLDATTLSGRGLGNLLDCADSNERAAGIDRFALADDASSALASLAAVHKCLAAGQIIDGVKRVEDETSYALCGAEWRALDRAAVDRELAQLKVHPAVRAHVHIALRQVEGTVAATDAYLAPKVKDDPVLKNFYYDVPDKAFKLAAKVYKENAEDLAAVRTFEAAYAKSSRPQVKGCFAELRARLIGLVKRKKATTFDKLRYEMVGPIGYQISRALEACGRKDGQPELAQFLAKDLEKADDFRGPRTMVYWFLRDALKEMEGEKPTTVETLDRLRPRIPDPLGRPGSNGNWSSVTAPIKKVTKKGGAVLVEFETVVTKDQDRECWDTKKVRKINADGTVDYERQCGPWKKVTRRDTEAPAIISTENAAGLAPGRLVGMYCTESDVQQYQRKQYGTNQPRPCAAYVVASKKTKEVVAFLGAAL